MLNVLSIASWLNRPLLGAYGATRSAACALTLADRMARQVKLSLSSATPAYLAAS
jgi:hypothetical protein